MQVDQHVAGIRSGIGDLRQLHVVRNRAVAVE